MPVLRTYQMQVRSGYSRVPHALCKGPQNIKLLVVPYILPDTGTVLAVYFTNIQ